jgi:hypothetical protein
MLLCSNELFVTDAGPTKLTKSLRCSFDHLVGEGESVGETGSYSSPQPATGSNLSAQPNTKPNHTL